MQALLSVFKFDMVYSLNWIGPAITAAIIGCLFPIVFSLFPIYYAGKTSILLTLKTANQPQPSSRQFIIRAIIGLSLLCFVFVDHPISYLAITASIIMLFPFLLIAVTYVLRPILQFLFQYAGLMAVKNLLGQLNRNANTAAILAVGISVMLLLGAAVESAPEALGKEIRNTYGGDVKVTSEAPWSAEDQAKLAAYESVTAVEPLTEATPITWETINGGSRQFSVFAVSEDGPSLFEHPEEKDLYKELGQKRAVLLGNRAFDEWGGRIGQRIQMNTPSGEQEFEVIGAVKTAHYTGYAAFMDEKYLRNEFGWTHPFDLLLSVNNAANDSLRDQLWNDFGAHLGKVQTVDDEIESTVSAVTGMNELLLVMLVFVIGLASIGTANTLLMNTLERIYEIGTMRALGFTKPQVIKMIVAEGMLIGLSGVIGGIAAGTILIYVTSKSEFMEGFLTFQLPVSNVILAMISGVLLSLCAAWTSSRSASNMDIPSSLKEG